MTEPIEAELRARAFVAACDEEPACVEPIYAPHTLEPSVRATIDDAVEFEVAYVNIDELLRDAGGVLDAGVFIQPQPVQVYMEGVVGVDVWVGTGGLQGGGQTYLFRWDGAGWIPTTGEEVGITTTSAIA